MTNELVAIAEDAQDEIEQVRVPGPAVEYRNLAGRVARLTEWVKTLADEQDLEHQHAEQAEAHANDALAAADKAYLRAKSASEGLGRLEVRVSDLAEQVRLLDKRPGRDA